MEWITVPDSELERAVPDTLFQAADVVLGGHSLLHRRFDSRFVTTAPLRPIRIPVVDFHPGDSILNKLPQNKEWRGFAKLSGPSAWETDGQILLLPDPAADTLARAFCLTIFEAAPDQSAGYARWVKLAGSVTNQFPKASKLFSRIGLREIDSVSDQSVVAWSVSPELSVNLGVSQTDPIFWPEAISWRNDSQRQLATELFYDFCRMTRRAASETATPNPPDSSRSFRTLMASILLHDCVIHLRKTWQAIRITGPENRKLAENYLVGRPPWPPASVLRLRNERGFEFVVSLVEQLAVDRDQREWLIKEFQSPESEIDFRVLDASDRGRLIESIRFQTWLRAEWSAWVAQRCRRALRFLALSQNESDLIGFEPQVAGTMRTAFS